MGQESEEPAGVDPEVKVLRDRIDAVLGDSLDEQWTEVLNQWGDAAPSERRTVRADVSRLRDQLLDSLRVLNSLDALKRSLALGYVEMKCQWTRLNAQIQHKTAHGEQVPESLFYRAACVSLMVQALEPLLTRASVEDVADVVVDALS